MTTKNDALKYMEKKFGRLTFGKALRAWREADSRSQVEFAKRLGISVQSLCDIEKGRRIPTPVRAAKIAKQLGVHELSWVQLAIQDSLNADGFRVNVKLVSA